MSKKEEKMPSRLELSGAIGKSQNEMRKTKHLREMVRVAGGKPAGGKRQVRLT